VSTLVRFDRARIETPGAALAATIDLELVGPRSVLVGDARAIVAALGGAAAVTAGTVSVLDRPLPAALNAVRVAPLDPPLLGDLTPLQHLAWAACLAGLDRIDARVASVSSLLALGPWSRRPLSITPLAVRRAVVLGAAAITEPPLLVAEAPLDGLDSGAAGALLGAIGRLVGARSAIVTTEVEPVEGTAIATLASGASEVVRLG
jgi:ABC-type multidrug transport system ATPase subunit